MATHSRWFTGVWNRPPWHVFEGLVLAAVLLAVYVTLVGRVMMHIDENQFIATSSVLEPFVHGDRSSAVWAEAYFTLNAPPGTRFIVGIGRALGGYGPDDLITIWAFEASAEQNAAAGAMPSDDLLWWSRLPMALLAAMAGMAGFLLMRGLFGTAAGYTGLALIVLNPWLGTNLVRAMAEAPLLCSLLVVIAAATRLVVVANHGAALHERLPWLAVAGVGAGFAATMKLNGLTSVVGVLVVWILTVALEQGRSRSKRLAVAIWGCCVVLLAAAATVLVFNPYLDPDPLGRFIKMVQFRSYEMSVQLQIKPWWPIKGPIDRSKFVFSHVFQQAVLVHHPVAGVVSLALWLAGLGYIVRGAYNSFRRGMLDPAAAAMIVALTAAGPMLATPLRWDRYMFLPVWFSALLVALGFTVCVRWLIGVALKRSGWRAGARFDETTGWPRTRPES